MKHASTIAIVLLAALTLLPAPAAARTIRVGVDAQDLPAALALAVDGDTVALGGRTHHGGVRLERAVTLRGPGTIDGGGKGHVVEVHAAGVRLVDLAVVGSGADLMRSDACVWFGPKARGSAASALRLERCTFGLYVHETHGVRIERCSVRGSETGLRSARGNGIHLFDAEDTHVLDNVVTGGRDGIYVSATEHSTIARNRMSRTRFGVHYMFSLHNVLRGNVAEDNVTGFAIMESHHIDVVGNQALRNSDHGILFRDATDSEIAHNLAEFNGEGLFFFSSVDNRVHHNRVLHNGVGAKVWAGSDRNEVAHNAFVGNRRQIFYVASSDLRWGTGGVGNHWGDYLGWDQDGDGVGDRPYRVDSFVAHLLYRFPQAGLLVRSPALELLAMLSDKMPLWQVKTVIDERPLARPPAVAALEPTGGG
ncbi:MAG: nitrous oxide reductase family maturation protein NosD [Deltaproteobacteria bacterium]|nr:nitrous oxide reductase family maturation protein NosD [Deltaproteobacteria bacterium]